VACLELEQGRRLASMMGYLPTGHGYVHRSQVRKSSRTVMVRFWVPCLAGAAGVLSVISGMAGSGR